MNPARFIEKTVTDFRKITNDGIMKGMEDIDAHFQTPKTAKNPK